MTHTTDGRLPGAWVQVAGGEWLVRVTGWTPRPGAEVHVTTRKGKVRIERVAEVVSRGFSRSGEREAFCRVVEDAL